MESNANRAEQLLLEWQTEEKLSLGAIGPIEQQWLTHTGSLTQRLRGLTDNQIQHRLRFENWGEAFADERLALSLQPDEPVWEREIDWTFNNTTWVIGRVIVPKQSMVEEASQLEQLRHISLGDVLFRDPNLVRAHFEFAKLSPARWVRRCVFHFHNKPLLVSEVFTPQFFEYVRAH